MEFHPRQWIVHVGILVLMVVVAVLIASIDNGATPLIRFGGVADEAEENEDIAQEESSIVTDTGDTTQTPPPVAPSGLVGSYSGVLPCIDCAGIDTDLMIRANGTFTFTELYLGRSAGAFGDANQFVSEGVWRVEGNALSLAMAQTGETRSYRIISANELRALDEEGRDIQSDRNHSLTRAAAAAAQPELTGRTWTWVRTERPSDDVVHPNEADEFTIRLTDGGAVSVATDCDTYNGTYRTNVRDEIDMTIEAATDECSGASQAPAFVKMLTDSNRYYLVNGGLYLGIPFESGLVVFE